MSCANSCRITEGGAFFGGGGGEWGQSDEWGVREGEGDGEESYSEEDDFTKDQEDIFGIDFEDEEEEGSDADEDASEYSDDDEDDEQGDIEQKDSPETYENADVSAFDAFDDDDGGFADDDFENGFGGEQEDDEESYESASGSYDEEEESPSQSGSEYVLCHVSAFPLYILSSLILSSLHILLRYDDDLQQADEELESQIENDDWDGVARSVQSFEPDEDEQSSEGSEYTEDMTAEVDIRTRVEELVRKKIPDEIDNLDDMMQQFQGREDDLIQALMAMEGEDDSGSIEDASHDEGQSPRSDEQSQFSGEEEVDEEYSGSQGEEEYSQEDGGEGR